MSIASLWLELCLTKLPQNPKISKFLWGNSQSPAPSCQEPLKKRRPPALIYSLACSFICTNPYYHIWSVAGIVSTYSYPKHKNFEISMGEFTLPQSNQDPC